MHRATLLLALGTTLATACSSSAPAPRPYAPQPPPTSTAAPATQPVALSIVATSDLHGYLDRAIVFGGYVDNLRKVRAADGAVVLIDAGDMFQGTLAANLSEGASVIRAYNALRYDSATIGNHEFDYGPLGSAAVPASPSDERRGALLAAAQQASFPLLAANYLDKETKQPVSWPGVRPFTIVTAAGVRVAIIGVSSAETLDATIAGNVVDLTMAPLAETIRSHAKRLRQEGADVIVVAAHAGGQCDRFDNPKDLSSCKADAEIFDVARALDPADVNVIIGAHTHQAIAHEVNGIPVIQSWAYGSAFGRVDLSVSPGGEVRVVRIHPPQRVCTEEDSKATTCTPGVYEGMPVAPNAAVRDAVHADLESAAAKRAEPLGVTLNAELSAKGKPSSPLGLAVAQWMLAVRPRAKVAIMNEGGIRASLPAGPLTYGPFYEMFPFDNRFASITVEVALLEGFLRTALQRGEPLAVAGLKVHARCKGGTLEVELLDRGRALPDNERVVVLMSDYMATTSRVQDAGMAKERFEIEADPPIREALVEHLRQRGGTVDPPASPHSLPKDWPATCQGGSAGPN